MAIPTFQGNQETRKKTIDWKFILFINIVIVLIFSIIGLGKYFFESYSQPLNMVLYTFIVLVVANIVFLFSSFIVKIIP